MVHVTLCLHEMLGSVMCYYQRASKIRASRHLGLAAGQLTKSFRPLSRLDYKQYC
jgi:hypothetical protein